MFYAKMLCLFFFASFLVSFALTGFQVLSPPLLANHDSEEIERLVEQLGSDSFREREAAVESLRRIGRPALPALRNALHSTDPEI